MIRPVFYVDLPGIIYALDMRARGVGRSFARFICAPDYEEIQSGLGSMLLNMLPVRPAARTWISEDHWRLQGVAQSRIRPHTSSWDLVYLASLTHHDANPTDVILELIEYVLNAAISEGTGQVFARTGEHPETLAIFQRAGFQCYARELLYVRPPQPLPETAASNRIGIGKGQLALRRWTKHDVWALTRLHDATTPRRVQIAETLGSKEIVYQFVPRRRTWSIPGIEPHDESYVVEQHGHLVAWVRIRQRWADVPHQIWVKLHPEYTSVADVVMDFGLQRLSQMEGDLQRVPVICHVRDYEGSVIDALRHSGFEHQATKAILVRHLTLHAFNERSVQSIDKVRINYGVKGLGTVQSVPINTKRETLHAVHDH
jgi:hypothetical protein